MNSKDIEKLLRETAVFQTLDDKTITHLAGQASKQYFSPNQYLCREEEEANQFFLLLEGKVALTLHVPARGELSLQTVSKGEVLGWSWLFPPHLWSHDAKALQDVTVLSFQASQLRQLCEENTTVGYTLTKLFSGLIIKRLLETRLRLVDMYSSQAQDPAMQNESSPK